MAGRVLVAPCSHAQWGAHGYHPTWPELPRTSARVVGGAGLVVSLDFYDAIAARFAERIPRCYSRFEVTNLVVCWWWLGLEGFIPPPVGALAGGPGPRWHSGR